MIFYDCREILTSYQSRERIDRCLEVRTRPWCPWGWFCVSVYVDGFGGRISWKRMKI